MKARMARTSMVMASTPQHTRKLLPTYASHTAKKIPFMYSFSGKRGLSPSFQFLSQMYECKKWETEHYNSVLEITVAFLYCIGFSPPLHLQCRISTLHSTNYAVLSLLASKQVFDRNFDA